MSDYASVAEEARRAFASVARLEAASMQDPASKALRINLAAKQKLANQMRERLFQAAKERSVEICNYRLIQVKSGRYGLLYVSDSMLNYQYLFTQVHDARKSGPKSKASFGNDVLEESMLEVGYTYSGSLGIVLMVPSDPDLFDRTNLDNSIDTFFRVIEIERTSELREIAKELGNAVIKRVHDWSAANVRGGFDADVRWSRSDGRQLGQLVQHGRMEKLVNLIEATSAIETEIIEVTGTLVGIDVKAGTFHFVVPNGNDYRGFLARDFDRNVEIKVNKTYLARISEARTTIYATEQTRRERVLLFLRTPPIVVAGT